MDGVKLKQALFFERLNDGKVQCRLCPRTCTIADGKLGACLVRKNIGGTLYALTYRKASAISVDPIEKKPLYHFYPGSDVLSYGSVGCNLKCRYCQNHHISQRSPEEHGLGLRETGGPATVMKNIIRRACGGVAFTYNEPTIWYEFVYETARAVKEKGYYTTLVSNGYMNPEPLKQLTPYIDAANIDLKSITDEDYVFMSKAHLQPVLNTIKHLHDSGVLVELTTLVATDFNDSEDKIREISRWVVSNLDQDIAMHFTRYRPEYHYTAPPTSLEFLRKTYDLAREEGLRYVYVGNTRMRKYNNTFCHNCGEMMIGRDSFYTRRNYDYDPETGVICSKCRTPLPIIATAKP